MVMVVVVSSWPGTRSARLDEAGLLEALVAREEHGRANDEGSHEAKVYSTTTLPSCST